MDILNHVQILAILVLPVLFAITVHEAAHGWAAGYLGDRTARMLGRVTLNPLKHIDPIGTIVVPLATFFLTGFLFGWAKPVPVDVRNLHNPRRDMALVALAGPGANLVMAVIWGLVASPARRACQRAIQAVAGPPSPSCARSGPSAPAAAAFRARKLLVKSAPVAAMVRRRPSIRSASSSRASSRPSLARKQAR